MHSATQPATLGRRLGAVCYDLLIQLALWFVATALWLPWTGGNAVSAGNLAYSAYLVAVSFLYNAWSWTHGGQTVGMRAWHLYALAADAQPLSWRQAGLRYCAACVSAASLGWGYLSLYFDPQRRTWHERFSRTVTLYRP